MYTGLGLGAEEEVAAVDVDRIGLVMVATGNGKRGLK